MKVFNIVLIFFVLSTTIFLSLKLKLTILDLENKNFKNFNFQGIECINDEIYIISNFDNKIYKLNEKFELEDFLDTKIVYKNKPIFSHITSFYLKKDTFYGVNSMDKINGVLVKSNLLKNKNSMILSNLPYEIIFLKSNINHFEYFSNGREILISHSQSSKNKKNTLKVEIDGILKCEIENKLPIQNMFFNNKTEEIFIISNLLKYYVGIIYKISIEDLCKKKNINFFNIKNKELIVFPFYEMEGYAYCNNKEFFIYINDKNSLIYYR